MIVCVGDSDGEIISFVFLIPKCGGCAPYPSYLVGAVRK